MILLSLAKRYTDVSPCPKLFVQTALRGAKVINLFA